MTVPERERAGRSHAVLCFIPLSIFLISFILMSGCLQASYNGVVTTVSNAQFPQLGWDVPPDIINATIHNPQFSQAAAMAAYEARKQVTVSGYQVGDKVIFTYEGGPDDKLLVALTFRLTDSVTLATSLFPYGKPAIDQKYTFTTGDTDLMTIQVNGTFSDGTQQVLLLTQARPPSLCTG